MSIEYPDPPEQPPYSPPPATTNPYGNQPYGQQPSYGAPPPYGQPQYGPPPPQYGPPPAAYNAYGYPPAGGDRPGQVTGASVLAYVLAGLLILAGALLLAGASTVDSFGNEFNHDTSSFTTELAFDGFANLVAAGLLIAGGVALSGRHSRGRTMLAVGAAITLVESVYWLVRTSTAGAVLVFVMLFGALAVISLVLAVSGTASQWLGAARTTQPPPAYRG